MSGAMMDSQIVDMSRKSMKETLTSNLGHDFYYDNTAKQI